MQTIYANTPFLRRMNLSAFVVVAAFLFGFWELWAAVNPGPRGPGYGYIFAILVIGGGAYAMWQLVVDHPGTVVRIDADGTANKVVLYLWRPFLSKRVAGGLGDLTDWRFEKKTLRASIQIPMLVVDHPGFPQPLRLELGKGVELSKELRALAPEAVAAYETSWH